MLLYIMRHGQAEPRAASDRVRQLTPAGVAEVAAIAPAYLAHAGGVGRVFCSPYDRARQTAQGMVEGMELEAGALQVADPLGSGESALHALDWLQSHVRDDALLVSHVPLVAELTSLLLAGHMEMPLSFQPATIVALQLEEVGLGTGEQLWLRHPADWRAP